MIVKTKYLPDSDLVRLQSICVISQDIAYICNKVIRPAEPDERKKIKERIRDIMVLLNCNFRIGKIRLGVKDSIQIHMDQFRKKYELEEYPRLYVKYSNVFKTVDVSLSGIRMTKLLSIIKELTSLKDALIKEFDFDKSELGNYKQLPAKIIKDELGRITKYTHGGNIVQDMYDKYWFIYTNFIDHQGLDREISKFFILNRETKSIEIRTSKDDWGYVSPIAKIIVGSEKVNTPKDMLPSNHFLNGVIKAIRAKYPR